MIDHDIPMAEDNKAIASDFAEIEKKLRQNQDRLTAAFLKHPTPVAISTLKDGKYIDVNEAFARSMGYRRAELIGQTSTGCGYITPEGRALVLRQFQEKGYCENLELPIRVRGGELRYGLFNSAKIKLRDEEYLLTVVTDVTDRKIIQEALQSSEERFRDFFQHANVGATQVTPAGRILRVNDRAAKLFGYASAEEMKNEIEDVRTALYVNPERRQEGAMLLQQQGYLDNFEAECRRKDGSTFWISYDTRAVRDPEGNIIYYDAISHDVTDRKRAEEMLRKTTERYQTILSQLHIGALIVGEDNNIEYANKSVCNVFGLTETPAELIGLRAEEMIAKASPVYADPDAETSRLRRIVANGLPVFGEEVRLRDGRVILRDHLPIMIDGRESGRLWLQRDITYRKRYEVAMQQSEQRLRSLFETSQDAIFIVDKITGRFLDANSSACRLYGYSRNEFLQMKHIDISAEPEKTSAAVSGALTDIPLRWHRKKDGAVFPVEITGSFFRDGESEIHTAFIRDITMRKDTDDQLHKSEERFALLANGTFEGILIQKGGIIIDTNNTLTRLFGYEHDEVIGKNIVEFVAPQSYQLIQNKLEEGGNNQELHFEAIGRRKDNTIFPVEIISKPVQYTGIEARVVAIRDITERKKNELELQQAEIKFRKIFYYSPLPMAINAKDDGRFIEINDSFVSALGYSRSEVIGKTSIELNLLMNINDQEKVMKDLLSNGHVRDREIIMRHKMGEIRYYLFNAEYIDLPGGKYILTTANDINLRKQAEEILHKSHEDLEAEVAKRTSELREINAKMIEEIEERVKIENELLIKSANLKEMNTALNVLIKNKEENRLDIEKKVLANAKEIILPYLTKLKNSRLDPVQSNLAEIIERGINDIISPFMQSLKSHYSNLTCRETEIINLIKEGKTTKEIAEIMGISERSIDGHRLNIRKKLGLNNKDANLRNFLVSLP